MKHSKSTVHLGTFEIFPFIQNGSLKCKRADFRQKSYLLLLQIRHTQLINTARRISQCHSSSFYLLSVQIIYLVFVILLRDPFNSDAGQILPYCLNPVHLLSSVWPFCFPEIFFKGFPCWCFWMQAHEMS